MLKNLICKNLETPIMYVDNQSTIKLIKNPEFHKRSKHIEVKYHFVRQLYEEEVFVLQYIHTNEQIADICTKPLSKTSFERMRDKLGVIKKE